MRMKVLLKVATAAHLATQHKFAHHKINLEYPNVHENSFSPILRTSTTANCLLYII